MNIKDYIEILNFILNQTDSQLEEMSLIEFVELLFEVPINHKRIKDFLLNVAINSDF